MAQWAAAVAADVVAMHKSQDLGVSSGALSVTRVTFHAGVTDAAAAAAAVAVAAVFVVD